MDIQSIVNKLVYTVKRETKAEKRAEEQLENSENSTSANTEGQNSSNEKITMSSSSFADIMEKFQKVGDNFYKITLGIKGYDSEEIDADIELIKKEGYEELSEEEAEYKETLMIASGQQKEFSTDMEQISDRMNSFSTFIKHLIKAQYPDMNDEEIDKFISNAKDKVLTDLQSGSLPVKSYDEGYNMRNILHLFQGVALGSAFAQNTASIIKNFGSNNV